MKIKKLIKDLQKLDPELVIYLQTDPEGNGYEGVRGVEETVRLGEDFLSLTNSADDNGMEEDEWVALKEDPKSRVALIFP